MSRQFCHLYIDTYKMEFKIVKLIICFNLYESHFHQKLCRLNKIWGKSGFFNHQPLHMVCRTVHQKDQRDAKEKVTILPPLVMVPYEVQQWSVNLQTSIVACNWHGHFYISCKQFFVNNILVDSGYRLFSFAFSVE